MEVDPELQTLIGKRGKETTRRLITELKACSSSKNLTRGRKIHKLAVQTGDDSGLYVANTLISMYAKCRSMEDACRVFDSLKNRDAVSWTALILGYVEYGKADVALDFFSRMHFEGCAADTRTFLAVLKACSVLAANGEISGKCRERANALRLLVWKCGCSPDIFLENSFLDVYARLGSMEDARMVFDSIEHPDVVSWNVLISGYADNGSEKIALTLLAKMRCDGFCSPNARTFVAALKALSKHVTPAKGNAIHLLCCSNGCDSDVYVEKSLVNMYAKCGCMEQACQVFGNAKSPDVVCWNALIYGYASNGQGDLALSWFLRMEHNGCPPDSTTFVAAIMACIDLLRKSEAGCNRVAKEINILALRNGCDLDMYVQSSLMKLYAKCGMLKEARDVFNSMKSPDVVAWTTLILGYAENGETKMALEHFKDMKHGGCVPNAHTFCAVLKVCGKVGALEIGRAFHGELLSMEHDTFMTNCLVDFYTKCGSLVEAEQLFEFQPARDLVTWNALIGGYSCYGDSGAVLSHFDSLLDSGLRPDGVTFLYVLTACSHAGLVDKGSQFFELMSSKYGIEAQLEHCTCMIDILGRSNNLDDAMELLRRMFFNPNAVTWRAVLGACRKWRHVELENIAFQSLTSFAP